jgi:hypothetical protein
MDVTRLITFLETKNYDAANLIDIGFDDQDIGDGFAVVGESEETEEGEKESE